MAQLTVRNVDDKVYETLKSRAARNHRSLEAEIRAVLERTARDEMRQEFLRWTSELRERMTPRDTGDVTAEIRAERDSR